MSDNEHPNILLVDDKIENLLALEVILKEFECNLIRATSGQQALRRVLEHEFALVLLDVQMPGMDGFEVAELMKSRQESKDIPIIFITAISKEHEYVMKGFDVGAVNYMYKPVDPDKLRSKVRRWLNIYRWGKK